MKIISNNIIILYVTVLLSISLFFVQCRKDSDSIIVDPSIPLLVSGGVYGVVNNERGLPEADVSVSHNGTTVKSDKNGVFILKDQLLNKAGAQIKFEKQGYYMIYKSVIPIKNQLVSTNIQLVPRVKTQIVNSVTGGVVVTNGSAQVSFQANSMIDASGNIYKGNVNVYAYWMDPSKESTFLEMPGNLTGRDLNGKEVVLQTLGMMAVELEDPAGNPLNIAKDKTAELKIPIPASLDSKAKTTIPMWYYDATKGGWIEEGMSTRVGQFYVANVAHFTLWNWDFSYPAVDLKFRIVDLLNHPIGYMYINVVDNITGQHGNGFTNPDGSFEGKIPASSNFTMTIGDLKCFTPFSYTFSSLTSSLDLGDIKLNISSKHIFGKLLDCNNLPVNKGYLQVWNSNIQTRIIPISASGIFDENIAYCSTNDLNYNGIDLTNFKESDTKVIQNQGPFENDLGDILICNEINYLNITIKGILINFIDVKQIDNGSNVLFGLTAIKFTQDTFGYDSLNFTLPEIKLGKVNPLNCSGILNSSYYTCTNTSELEFTITTFGPIGQFIKGTFEGKLKDWVTNQNENIIGDFQIRRKY